MIITPFENERQMSSTFTYDFKEKIQDQSKNNGYWKDVCYLSDPRVQFRVTKPAKEIVRSSNPRDSILSLSLPGINWDPNNGGSAIILEWNGNTHPLTEKQNGRVKEAE